ncbi:MAG: CIA30 family protein [Candidatus Delongbacteria bacterium]|nr:CIA30 family protein [Candidatus Delongbacteria bacterium]
MVDFFNLLITLLKSRSILEVAIFLTIPVVFFTLFTNFWLIKKGKIKNSQGKQINIKERCIIWYFVISALFPVLLILLCFILYWRSMRIDKVISTFSENHLLVPFDTLYDGKIFVLEGLNSCKGTNSFGEEWQNFNDNKLNGHSSCYWNSAFDTISNFCNLSVTIKMGKSRTEPYAGIVSFFSPEPVKPFDCSKWNGIALELRSCPECNNDSLKYWVQLGTLDISNFEYYEASLPVDPNNHEWKNIQIPFKYFSQPYWSNTCKKGFDLRKIFKIAIYARGNLGEEATLQIRNIRLFL